MSKTNNSGKANNGGADSKKLVPLYILDILTKYSDADHPLKQADILDRLRADYGIDLERKAVGRNIELLRKAGHDIGTTKEGSYLEDRYFEDSEIAFLVHVAAFARSVKSQYANEIIQKLENMASVSYQKGSNILSSHGKDIEKLHSLGTNAALLFNITAIMEAIAKNRCIEITCAEYDENKKLQKGNTVVVTPIRIAFGNGGYFLVAMRNGMGYYENYRLDKILDVKFVENQVGQIQSNNNFDLADYMHSHPYMKGGKAVSATLIGKKDMIGEMVDLFGDAFTAKQSSGGDYIITCRATEDELVEIGLRNNSGIEVVSPQSVRDKIRKAIDNMAGVYSKTDTDEYNDKFGGNEQYTVLTLDNVQVKDRHEHEKQTKLRNAIFSHNGISDFAFLGNNAALRDLTIIDNPVSDLAGIAALKNLVSLHVEKTEITDLSFLKKNKRLETLTVIDCPVCELPDMATLPELWRLELENVRVKDLDFLIGSEVNDLTLLNMPAVDMTTLIGVDNIAKLTIDDTLIGREDVVEFINERSDVVVCTLNVRLSQPEKMWDQPQRESYPRNLMRVLYGDETFTFMPGFDEKKAASILAAEERALPEYSRKVIELIYEKGYSLRRTASALGISPESADRYHARALMDLRRPSVIRKLSAFRLPGRWEVVEH